MFSSHTKVIQVQNDVSDNILFIIPNIDTIQGQMFEIYIMVSEKHDNVDLFFLVYNIFRNKLQEEASKSGDPYPWLELNDSKRKMTDRQNMDSKMTVNQSYMSKEEKEEVYDLFSKTEEHLVSQMKQEHAQTLKWMYKLLTSLHFYKMFFM